MALSAAAPAAEGAMLSARDGVLFKDGVECVGCPCPCHVRGVSFLFKIRWESIVANKGIVLSYLDAFDSFIEVIWRTDGWFSDAEFGESRGRGGKGG